MGAFALLLKEEGYRQIKVGDSCGTSTARKVMELCGMDQILSEQGVQAVDFDRGVRVDFPQGRQAKEFVMAAEVEESDALINVCKMKTHQLERITGAVKNLYGCIYGFHKAKGHTSIQTPTALPECWWT